MPLDRPVADLVGMARSSRSGVRRAIEALVGENRDARELLLDDTGALKPAAARLFGRLAREAGLHRIGFEPDARRQDYRLGQQHMVRRLAEMVELDVARLQQLQRQLGDER